MCVQKYLVVPNLTSRVKPVPDCAGKMARKMMNQSGSSVSAREMTKLKYSPLHERSEATVVYAYEPEQEAWEQLQVPLLFTCIVLHFLSDHSSWTVLHVLPSPCMLSFVAGTAQPSEDCCRAQHIGGATLSIDRKSVV